MYVVYETLQVNAGRQKEVEERLAWGHVLMQPLPGFVEAHVFKYLGNPSQYLAIRAWEDRTAYQAWEASEARAQYIAARPTGLYLSPPVIEYFETVTHVRGTAAATYAERRAFQVVPGQFARFEEQRHSFAELLAGVPGLSSVRALRFLGDDSTYVQVSLWASREARETFRTGPVFADFFRSHPGEGLYLAPPANEHYEVIHAL